MFDIDWKYGFRPFTQGRHGLTGTVRMGSEQVVIKASNHATLTGLHEHTILSAIAPLALPFFPCPLGCKTAVIDLCALDAAPALVSHAYDTVFASTRLLSRHLVPKTAVKAPIDICCMTYFAKAKKVTECVSTLSPHVLASVARQTLHAMATAHVSTSLTHYDLHANNVMVDKCDPDIVIMFDGPVATLVPTHGALARVIDFGFAWCDNLYGEPVTGAVEFQDKGFMPQPDPYADMRVFLSSLASEVCDRVNRENLTTHAEVANTLERLCDHLCTSEQVSRKNGWLKLCTNYLPTKLALAFMLETANTNYNVRATGTHLHVAQLLTALCSYPLDSPQVLRPAYRGFSTQRLLKQMEKLLRLFSGAVLAMLRDKEPPESVLVLVRAIVLQYLKSKKDTPAAFASALTSKLRGRVARAGGERGMLKLHHVLYDLSATLQHILAREFRMRQRALNNMYATCEMPIPGSPAAAEAHMQLLNLIDKELHTPFVYTENTCIVRIPCGKPNCKVSAAVVNTELAHVLNHLSLTCNDGGIEMADVVNEAWARLEPSVVPEEFMPGHPSLVPRSPQPVNKPPPEREDTGNGLRLFDYPNYADEFPRPRGTHALSA